jgi:hypothetical protein
MARISFKVDSSILLSVKRRVLIGSVLVVALVASMVVLFGYGPARGDSSTAVPPTPSAATQQQMWNQAQAAAQADAPEPLLPQDQRTAWIGDFQAFADCMHSNGISGFPNAPSMFGDGKTAAPVTGGPPGSDMDPSSAKYQAALTTCPMNTSNLDLSDFQQANSTWQTAHGGGAPVTSGPEPVPGS